MLESRLSHLRIPLAAILINNKREKEKKEIQQTEGQYGSPPELRFRQSLSQRYPIRMQYFQAANFVELASCLVEVDSLTKDQSQQPLHLPLVLRMTNPYARQPFVLPIVQLKRIC